jgi:hypothetical protein
LNIHDRLLTIQKDYQEILRSLHTVLCKCSSRGLSASQEEDGHRPFLADSPDRTKLASGGADTTIGIWDVSGLEP